MTFAEMLSAADSPRRVEIHATLDEGWRRRVWLGDPVAYVGCVPTPGWAASDVRPPPGSNPGGPDPHALLHGGANGRSYLPALAGSTGGCTGGGGILAAAAE